MANAVKVENTMRVAKKTDFELAVAKAISDEWTATKTSEQNQLQSDFHNAVMQFKTDEDQLLLQEAYLNAVNSEWYYQDTTLGNKIDKMYQSALGGVKQQLTVSESIKEATKLKSLYTVIPSHALMNGTVYPLYTPCMPCCTPCIRLGP